MLLAHQKKSVSPQERRRTGTLLKVKAPPGGLDMLQRPLHNLKDNKDAMSVSLCMSVDQKMYLDTRLCLQKATELE